MKTFCLVGWFFIHFNFFVFILLKSPNLFNYIWFSLGLLVVWGGGIFFVCLGLLGFFLEAWVVLFWVLVGVFFTIFASSCGLAGFLSS